MRDSIVIYPLKLEHVIVIVTHLLQGLMIVLVLNILYFCIIIIIIFQYQYSMIQEKR